MRNSGPPHQASNVVSAAAASESQLAFDEAPGLRKKSIQAAGHERKFGGLLMNIRPCSPSIVVSLSMLGASVLVMPSLSHTKPPAAFYI
jgi:hypothetical protein